MPVAERPALLGEGAIGARVSLREGRVGGIARAACEKTVKTGVAMRRLLVLLLLTGVCLTVSAIDTAALKSKCATKVEQLAQAMLPQEKMNRALAFFGPVTKKYLPVFNRFNDEYLKSANRISVIRKYLPQADAALAEARKMRVPAKYEVEKAEYIQMAEGFLTMTKLTVRLGE